MELFINKKLEIFKPEHNNDTVNKIIESMNPFDWSNDQGFHLENTSTLVMSSLRDVGDGNLYEGQRDADLDIPAGRGVQIWADGSRYDGFWRMGRQNGYGRLVHAEGDVYEGMWEDD